MRKTEQGSAHVIIISVLVVALIGAIGFIFWQNVLQPKPTDNSTHKSANSDNSSSKTDNKATSADLNKGYVVLDDWGVRFKEINSEISWSRTSVNSYNASNNNTYYFTTDAWKNLPTACNTEIPLIRMTEKDSTMMSPPVALNDEEKIGDYYYYYLSPHDACGGETMDSAAWSFQAKTVMGFLQTIEAKK